MKRTGWLIPKIASFENLQLAYYKAKKGKETKPEIIMFSKNLQSNLSLLQSQISSGNVEVGNYHYFTVYDPKERQICAASFSERVLHHAIMNVCHDDFEHFQITDSYATRLNKGTFKAVDKAWQYHKQNKYYLKLDVRKYFDSIDHTILKAMLNKMFKDPLLLYIFEQIINSYHTNQGKGIPIGNLTSQYFANHYLALLDHFIKEHLQIKAYLRYMDDSALWLNNLSELQNASILIQQFCKEKLDLQLKTNFINKSAHGLSFLGFRLFPNKKILSSRSKKRYIVKTIGLNNLLNNGKISQEEYQIKAVALNAFVEKAYTQKLKKQILCKT